VLESDNYARRRRYDGVEVQLHTFLTAVLNGRATLSSHLTYKDASVSDNA
jgi:hypothetical protein